MGGKPRSQYRALAPSPQAVEKLLQVLQETWGEAHCELDHDNAYQLLCATILSAQSTDRRINQVAPALFERYPDAFALARAEPEELEGLIRSTGFYRIKAQYLRDMARALVERHGGEVPRTMRQLIALPGVARKTANVVMSVAFGLASGIVVDTHVQRVSGRLGLSPESDPVKIERDLMAHFARPHWIDLSQQLIWHGRRICHARKPDCENCPVAPLCPSAEITGASTGSPAPGS